MQRRHGLAVIVVHHARKGAGNSRRPSPARLLGLHAWGDSNLYLRRDGETHPHRRAPCRIGHANRQPRTRRARKRPRSCKSSNAEHSQHSPLSRPRSISASPPPSPAPAIRNPSPVCARFAESHIHALRASGRHDRRRTHRQISRWLPARCTLIRSAKRPRIPIKAVVPFQNAAQPSRGNHTSFRFSLPQPSTAQPEAVDGSPPKSLISGTSKNVSTLTRCLDMGTGYAAAADLYGMVYPQRR